MLLSVIGICLLLKVLVNFLGLVNEPMFEDIISIKVSKTSLFFILFLSITSFK